MKTFFAAIAGFLAIRRHRPISVEVAIRAAEDEKLAATMEEMKQGLRENIEATIHTEMTVRAESGDFALPLGIAPTTIHFDELRIEPGNIIERRLATIEARLDRIESGEVHADLRQRRIL